MLAVAPVVAQALTVITQMSVISDRIRPPINKRVINKGHVRLARFIGFGGTKRNAGYGSRRFLLMRSVGS